MINRRFQQIGVYNDT